MESVIGKILKRTELVDIEKEVKDYALVNGIGFRDQSNPTSDKMTFIPFTLFPSPFPERLFNNVVTLQPIINRMIHSIACDDQFLTSTFEKIVKVDDFTKRLFNIYETVRKEGMAQDIEVVHLRSDYMLHQNDSQLEIKQVEVNTYSSALSGLAPKMRSFHRYMMSKYTSIGNNLDIDKLLPENQASEVPSNVFIKAFDLYNNPSAVVLFLVEDEPINFCDQRNTQFEFSVLRPDIRVVRRTFKELRNRLKLSNDKRLIIDKLYGEVDVEVAIVYFRNGYVPSQYEVDEDWNSRLIIERSKAIKIPSIRYHLAGSKKVQQLISEKSVLEKFVSSKNDLENLYSTFAGLWGLDYGDDKANKAIEMLYQDSDRFVLKPQREGGGNNLYGKEIFETFDKIKNTPERDGYILMELIRQPKFDNYIIRPDKSISEANFAPVNVIAELGIFGLTINRGTDMLFNSNAGHIVKSKVTGVNEGGIAAGYGAIDSPILVNWDQLPDKNDWVGLHF